MGTSIPICQNEDEASPRMPYNGYVYETFGISKHFHVKLQVLLIRTEMLDNPLTANMFYIRC